MVVAGVFVGPEGRDRTLEVQLDYVLPNIGILKMEGLFTRG